MRPGRHEARARRSWANVRAGQWRWRRDLNPRKTCAFTRFRVLRTAVHHCPPMSMTSPGRRPAAAGERPRTEVNEPKLSQGPGAAAGPMGRLVAGRVNQALRLEDATDRG